MRVRWQRHWQQRPGRCERKERPLSPALPPTPIDPFQDWKNFSAPNCHEGNNWRAMAESDFHIVIPKFLQPIRLAKKRESPANSLRIDRQQLVAIQHIIGILLTGDHAAQLCMKVEKKRNFDQA